MRFFYKYIFIHFDKIIHISTYFKNKNSMPIMVWNYKVVFTLINLEGDTTKNKIKNMWVKIYGPIY